MKDGAMDEWTRDEGEGRRERLLSSVVLATMRALVHSSVSMY